METAITTMEIDGNDSMYGVALVLVLTTMMMMMKFLQEFEHYYKLCFLIVNPTKSSFTVEVLTSIIASV